MRELKPVDVCSQVFYVLTSAGLSGKALLGDTLEI